MTLLLRKSVTLAAKKHGQRHLITSRDSWLVSSKRDFWQRRAPSSLVPTVRSLATSVSRDEDEHDKKSLPQNHSTSFPDLCAVNLPLKRQVERISPRNFLGRSERGPCGDVSAFFRADACCAPPSSVVRYVPPLTKIRYQHSLMNLVTSERAAIDLAARAFSTWATSYTYEHLAQSQRHFLVRRQAAFFSTNSDGSRIRDPRIVGAGIRKTKIPTPDTGEEQQAMKPEDVVQEISNKSKTVVLPALQSGLNAVFEFLLNLPKNLLFYLMNPSEIKEWWVRMKKVVKEEIDHYVVGSKLLWADLKTARNLIRRTLRGSSLTRRERKQLLRTISDLFRLVPFSMFLIIPLMEFALPFALRIFPNLLPSTFQDSLKAEENMKRELQSRIAMAKFFQETLEDLAKEQKKSATHMKEEIKESGQEDNIDESVVAQQEASAASFLSFMEKARSGEMIPNSVILDYAHYFKDDLTLDNMPRMQLINMCKYMGIAPYGSDSFLRFQLRHRMRQLQEDDQRILWEGIDSLTKMELREACQERGMRSTGLSKDAYKRALQQWLELSVKQNVPTSLLIMSRTFFLREEMFERDSEEGSKSLAGLADAISGLDKEVLNEVILDVATSQEKASDPGVRKIKLEVLMKQNELIEKEQAEREEAAAKKKEQAEKEAAEVEKLSSVDEPSIQDSQGEKFSEATKATGEADGFSNEQPDAAVAIDKPSKDTKPDEDLSAAEMEAISQLVSADPVSKERADLESIKAALQDEPNADSSEKDLADASERSQMGGVAVESIQFPSSERAQASSANEATDTVEQAAKVFSTEEPVQVGKAESDSSMPTDPVVARLKKRIESMVDKIEVQMSDVEVKIGDKLHVLDKDMDGILSVEEVAEALQQVLKRKITTEEAMEIAQQMDANKDGDLSVQELMEWVEMNQLVKFVEEGRDHDMDRIIEKQSATEQQDQQEDQSKVH